MGIKTLLECDKCGVSWDEKSEEGKSRKLTRIEIRFTADSSASMQGSRLNQQEYESFYCNKCLEESNLKWVKPTKFNPAPVQPTADEKITDFLIDLGVKFEEY